MHPRDFDREKSPYLVLSISLHIIALLALMHMQWDTHKKNTPIQEEEIPSILPLEQNVAALKTRASQFGAPVVFNQEPTLTSEPPQKNEDVSSKKNQHQDFDNTHNDKFFEEAVKNSSEHEPTMNDAQPKQTMFSKKETEKKPDQASSQQENTPPISKQLTFADLARGFIQTIKNEGQDLLERAGNENIRPDLEEMKLISYKEKVVWFIQNAFRIRSDEEPPHHEQIVKCHTLMTLDGEGKICNVKLVYSTGIAQFDKYYLDVLISAAPFPPVPQHIKKPFIFPFTMIYYTRRQHVTAANRRARVGFSFR